MKYLTGATTFCDVSAVRGMCGLEIDDEDDQVKRVRGDRDDVWSKGFLCPKGTTLGDLHDDPDRLRAPMVRDGDEWREVTLGRGVRALRGAAPRGASSEHGIEACTAYIGNPVVHNYSLGRYIGAVIGMSGIPRIWSAGTVDQWPKNLLCALMFGNTWKIPVPDVQRTDSWSSWAANPQASQGRCSRAPTPRRARPDPGARRASTIVVDPRRTGTAERADEWLPIMPGTDAACCSRSCYVLVAEGLVDLGGSPAG